MRHQGHLPPNYARREKREKEIDKHGQRVRKIGRQTERERWRERERDRETINDTLLQGVRRREEGERN